MTTPGDKPIVELADLAAALGGDEDSFTAALLRLLGKADTANYAKLRQAFPYEAAAWELWKLMPGSLTVAEVTELAREVAAVSGTAPS